MPVDHDLCSGLFLMLSDFAGRYKDISNLCHSNHYTLAFLTSAPTEAQEVDEEEDAAAPTNGVELLDEDEDDSE